MIGLITDGVFHMFSVFAQDIIFLILYCNCSAATLMTILQIQNQVARDKIKKVAQRIFQQYHFQKRLSMDQVHFELSPN